MGYWYLRSQIQRTPTPRHSHGFPHYTWYMSLVLPLIIYPSNSWTFLLKTFAEDVNIHPESFDCKVWDPEFPLSRQWIKPMMQFRGYDGLTWRFYDEDGERTLPLLVNWVEVLKETLEGDKIGPRVPVFFAGGPYGNWMQKYLASRNW